jgi:hypothetical protein
MVQIKYLDKIIASFDNAGPNTSLQELNILLDIQKALTEIVETEEVMDLTLMKNNFLSKYNKIAKEIDKLPDKHRKK